MMKAAGGAATNAVAGAVADGAAASGVNFISVALISVAAGVISVPEIGALSATRALAVGTEDAVAEDVFAVEDAFADVAFALEVEAAETDAEAGVDADAGRPRSSAAKADGDNGDPKTAKNMAITATLTSLPRRERKMRVPGN